ncbi:HNH endonuclease [Peribacillus frigoritolerans]|uniref:HNH endonuclease n=1 Tax=Peribacillus frigoritolerans TaxID=450367 RepID=UPI001F4F576C|nr:HNH endonuclease [Peribacillus frigoritolerans]MCK2020514.1 HNH endonuclease [Peribacillus frigoritolerans]
MSSFIVMQGSTYQEEKQLGIIWSPQIDKSGMVPHSWKRMQEVKSGNRIFHYVKGFIVAISVVKEGCKKGSKPQTMQNHHRWNDEGYLVSTEYRELEVPLNVRDHFDEIVRYLPIKYSAFQVDGSGNQGYLYPCNEELSLKLLECISVLNIYKSDEDQLELPVDEVIEKERNPLLTFIAETESEAKMKIRSGQQKFRKSLMPLWNNECPLCGIVMEVLLRASHAKPWKDSSDQERLDPYNGVLLCCNHDALYDKGLISFDGQGRLHISKQIPKEEYVLYGLEKNVKIPVHPENKLYFKWHKKNVFVENNRV